MNRLWIRQTNRTLVFVLIFITIISIGLLAGYAKSKSDVKEKPEANISGNDLSKRDVSVDSPGKSDLKEANSGTLSKAILAVEGMSCSGCIATIKSSLADMKGIKDIVVDVAGGKAQIYFDSNELKDTNQIAEAITSSGYPARLQKILSSEEIKDEQNLAARMLKSYIASVGDWNISRIDFESELKAARKRYENIYGQNIFKETKGQVLLGNLKFRVINGLINEGILLSEITKTNFKLEPNDLQLELEVLVQKKGISLDEFKKQLEDSDYPFDIFMKKFGNRILINRYLDEEILTNASNTLDKQRLYRDWFNNAKSLNQIVYYDKDLEQLVQNQSAQNSCCASGS